MVACGKLQVALSMLVMMCTLVARGNLKVLGTAMAIKAMDIIMKVSAVPNSPGAAKRRKTRPKHRFGNIVGKHQRFRLSFLDDKFFPPLRRLFTSVRSTKHPTKLASSSSFLSGKGKARSRMSKLGRREEKERTP